jgi:hypothetical protein
MRKYAQPRLRVRRLMKMPPRLKPSTAPSDAAMTMVPGEESPVVRIKRTEVYAIARVQKVNRRYILLPPGNCLTNELETCKFRSRAVKGPRLSVGWRKPCFSFRRVTLVTNCAEGGAAIESDKGYRGSARNPTGRKGSWQRITKPWVYREKQVRSASNARTAGLLNFIIRTGAPATQRRTLKRKRRSEKLTSPTGCFPNR